MNTSEQVNKVCLQEIGGLSKAEQYISCKRKTAQEQADEQSSITQAGSAQEQADKQSSITQAG